MKEIEKGNRTYDLSDENQSIANEPQASYEPMALDETSEKRKQKILEDIREALLEVKMAREGKIQMQTLEEFLHELRD